MNKTKQEATFIENCRYLGLKYLEAEYNYIIENAHWVLPSLYSKSYKTRPMPRKSEASSTE